MRKTTEYGIPDKENPEWTQEDFGKAMRYPNFPSEIMTAIEHNKRRGAQKAPTKQLISIRLSPDVLAALRAKGRGWQVLVDETLRKQFVKSV